MKTRMLMIAMLALWASVSAGAEPVADPRPMQGVPPSRESQVTMANYRDYPMSRWAFRNAGAVLHTVMVPRQGDIHRLPGPLRPELGERVVTDPQGQQLSFDALFEANYADAVLVMQGSRLLHEAYFHEFNEHSQHIWFSMTKSLASTLFGLLVTEGKVDLDASPAKYIPELKGSGFERVTIQQVLDHATAIDFHENYTDTGSDFFRFYAPALNLGWMPGAADVQPDKAEIYGVQDFLVHFVKPDPALLPGEAFDYNSSNADVLGWLIARISGQTFQDFLQQNLWAKLGTEHDAYLAVDRALVPVATGGMNTTLRDAARFGMMIRDRGEFGGQQVIPARWVDATLDVSDKLKANMKANPKYSEESWSAYHNMWWILDADAGEYCAVGIHGQVIYINRRADTVMVWFSSQPVASAARNPGFRAKLAAARQLAVDLTRKPGL
ncbi:MAG: beta-lactamase family protein [Gammaproteobacteria bacterium]|nr:beta-lactamase family protein [Gammaproteobacteria bacterium]MDH5171970.1 beta-lactamase family protein [Gammaproteobacteria bacterium]